VEWYKFNADIL
jgi:hypothetical protein